MDTGERHASDLKPGLLEQQSPGFTDISDDSNHLIKAKTNKNHIAMVTASRNNGFNFVYTLLCFFCSFIPPNAGML